jgi:hypothetical protein
VILAFVKSFEQDRYHAYLQSFAASHERLRIVVKKMPRFHPYRLVPTRKLVKGKIWNLPKKRKHAPDNLGLADTEGHPSTGDEFFAVCKHCAELMHKR